MGFTIPNYADAVTNKEVGDQAEPDSVDFQILGNPSNGVVYDPTNFANNARVRSTETISNSVRIDPYKVFINGVYYVNTSTSITLSLGEGTSNPRFDLVVIRASSPTASSPVVIAGTTSATNPEFPVITENDVVIAAVYRSGVGVSGYVDSSHIVDKRLFLNSNQTWVKSFSPITNTDGSATSAKIGDLWLDTSATANGQTMLWVKQSSGSWKNVSSYIEATTSATANTLVLRDGSGNFSATNASNASTVAGLAVHSARNNEANKVVRTDGSGYLQVGYINSSSGNENNPSSPARVWGTNGSDDYLRSYQTGYLNVNYANSAGSASSASSATTAGYLSAIVNVDPFGAPYIGWSSALGQWSVAGQIFFGNTLYIPTTSTGSSSSTRALVQNADGRIAVNTSLSLRDHKEQIEDLTGSLDIVNSLRPRTFIFKEETTDMGNPYEVFSRREQLQYGFIVEEVSTVNSDFIHHEETVDGIKPQMWKHHAIIAVLVGAVKELSTKNEDLEARIAALEAK